MQRRLHNLSWLFTLIGIGSISLFILGSCTAMANIPEKLIQIFAGPAGKDALEAGQQAVEAIEDKDNRKAHEHLALDKASEAAVEAAAAVAGAPIDVTIDYWDDAEKTEALKSQPPASAQ